LIPILFVVLLLGMVISISISLVSTAYIGFTTAWTLAALALPLGYVIRRRVPIMPIVEYLQCYIISMVYLCARGMAVCTSLTKRYVSDTTTR
jgi:hypothetical protein